MKTPLNPNDLLSYRMAIQVAPGARNVRLSNGVAGYSIGKRNWDRLFSALNACCSSGISLGFVMMDANTGMSVSMNADPERKRGVIGRVASALDAIHMEMPRSRSWPPVAAPAAGIPATGASTAAPFAGKAVTEEKRPRA